MGFDATVADPILKDVLYSKPLQSLVTDHKQWPLYSMLAKKKANFGSGAWGRHFILPFEEEDSQAVGGDLTGTETKAAGTSKGSAPKFNGYIIDPAVYYGTAQVDGVTALKADGMDNGSFVDAMTVSMKSQARTIGKRQACYLHGNGSSVLATISGTPTASPHTVTVGRASKRRLAVGMDLVAIDPATGTVRSATSRNVLAVNSLGKLTLDASPVALGWVDGDWLAPALDYVGGVIKGLEYLNPETEPTTTTLVHGCDINLNYKLGGMRYALSDYSDALAAIRYAAMDMGAEGSFPSHSVANPVTWELFQALLPDQTVYKTALGEGNIGFDTIKVRTPEGTFELMSDPAAKTTCVRFFDIEHLFMLFAGPALVHDLTAGTGAAAVRKGPGDSWIFQLRSVCQLASDKTNSLGVLTGFPVA